VIAMNRASSEQSRWSWRDREKESQTPRLSSAAVLTIPGFRTLQAAGMRYDVIFKAIEPWQVDTISLDCHVYA
jgi:hypothetical protein